MTREYLESIKAKPHGPDVAKLIAEIERCWDVAWLAEAAILGKSTAEHRLAAVLRREERLRAAAIKFLPEASHGIHCAVFDYRPPGFKMILQGAAEHKGPGVTMSDPSCTCGLDALREALNHNPQ